MSRCSTLCLVFLSFVSAVLVVASGNLPTASGQPKPPAVSPAPQAPTLTSPANLGVRKGETLELSLTGTNLADPLAVLLTCPGKASIPTDNKNGTDNAKLRVKVELPADCPIGLFTLRVATKNGVSNFRPFVVDDLPALAKVEGNRTKETAQTVPVPVVVTGRCDAEASDYYKVKVTAGQTLTFEVLARRLGSQLDPILLLHDAKTRRAMLELYIDDTPGLQSDCRITHTFKEAGEFLVEVRDTVYRGGPDFFYRLRIGEFPGVTTAYPVAVERGKTALVGFAGPGTNDIPAVSVKAPADHAIAAVYVTPKRSTGVSGWPVPVLLSDWPEIVEQEPNDEPAKATKLPVPGGVTARFDKAKDVDHFAVAGKKGQKLVAAVQTYEINTPTEVLIRVLDAKGAEIARSNPALPAARVEFTPAADGEYVLACEHLNYLWGPNEIYHLVVQPGRSRLRHRPRARPRRSAGRERDRGAGHGQPPQRLQRSRGAECCRRPRTERFGHVAGGTGDRVRAAPRQEGDETGRLSLPHPGEDHGGRKIDRPLRQPHRRREGEPRRHPQPAAGTFGGLRGSGRR